MQQVVLGRVTADPAGRGRYSAAHVPDHSAAGDAVGRVASGLAPESSDPARAQVDRPAAARATHVDLGGEPGLA